MMRRAPMKPGKGFARKVPSRAVTPASSAGVLRVDAVQREKKTKAIKSRGMKGRAPTTAEQAFMDAVASIGCIACLADGYENVRISIHHIDGRTKDGAHYLVLPLCGEHHQQDDSDPMGRIAVHPNKKRFEQKYGTQRELLAECIAIISGTDPVTAASAPEHLSLEQ
jgi:hypothetical protein